MTLRLSQAELKERREGVITAAAAVFLRYGYARTTMADLATAAGLSRPTLYLLFPDKDEIFTAVIRRLNRQMLDRFRSALPKLQTTDKRVQYCCEEWGAHGVEIMEKHADAKDLFDLAFPVVREMNELFVDFVAELLPEPAARSALNATPREIARNLVYSFRGLKEGAKDSAHLRRTIRLQVALVLSALERSCAD